MSATIIDGKAIAAVIQDEVRAEAASLRERGVAPCLAVVLVGEDPASQIYVRGKLRVAAEVGIESRDHVLPESTSQGDLLALIDRLNGDPQVHGILVQLPLPPQIDASAAILAVDPAKDVDGLHPLNVGALVSGNPGFAPCTPCGVLELLHRSETDLDGAEAVVVGRSNLVGKPTALLLLREHATVTLCHSHTRDLPGVCRRADVLIVAAGRAKMVTADYVKPGATVIDVGTSRVDGKLSGDVDFEAVKEVARALTPVPGGVGPMTIIMLMRNTIQAARQQARIRA